MAIQSDKQIARMCELPKFVITREQNVYVKDPDTEEKVLQNILTHEFSSVDFSIHQIADEYIKSDQEAVKPGRIIEIRPLNEDEKFKLKPMIYPFSEKSISSKVNEQGVDEKIISYGCSPYSYDITLAPEFKVFTNINTVVIDPKNLNEKVFADIKTDCLVVPPNSFVLGRSIEYINMPNVLTGVLLSKSTYARAGLYMFATVIQCGFSGHIVLEFANTTSLPIKLYANEGCAQILFLRGDTAPTTTYADKKGKYNNQTGITLPFV